MNLRISLSEQTLIGLNKLEGLSLKKFKLKGLELNEVIYLKKILSNYITTFESNYSDYDLTISKISDRRRKYA